MKKIRQYVRRWLANLWTNLHRSWEHVLTLEIPFHAQVLAGSAPRRQKLALRLEALEDRQMLNGAVLQGMLAAPVLGHAAVSGTAAGVIDPGVATSNPAASDDFYTVQQDHTLTVAANQAPYGLLYNDLAGDQGTLQVVTNTTPDNGVVGVKSDGSFTYTPNTGYTGLDSFSYTISADPNIPSANVSINVYATPTGAPTATDDVYTANPGVVLWDNVLCNDVAPEDAPLTATLVQAAQHGTLTLNPDGTFSYQAAAGYLGMDTFAYQAINSFGTSNTATASITVQQPSPVVNFPFLTVAQDQTLDFTAATLLAGDSDPQNLPLQITQYTQPANGTLVQDAGGAFHYTPNTGYAGWDSFTFTVTDGVSAPQVATTTIQVGGPIDITVAGGPGDVSAGGFGGGGAGPGSFSPGGVAGASGAASGPLVQQPQSPSLGQLSGPSRIPLAVVRSDVRFPAVDGSFFPGVPLPINPHIPGMTWESRYVGPTPSATPFHWLFAFENYGPDHAQENVTAHYGSSPTGLNNDPEIIPLSNWEDVEPEWDGFPDLSPLETDSWQWHGRSRRLENDFRDDGERFLDRPLSQDRRRPELIQALSRIHQESGVSVAYAGDKAEPRVDVLVLPVDDGE